MNGQTSAKQKNGSVELLRFVFTSIVIFFHINLDLWDQKKVVAVIRDVGQVPHLSQAQQEGDLQPAPERQEKKRRIF